MSYTLEVRSDPAVIWIVWGADFDFEADAYASAKDEVRVLDSAQEPMVAVYDLRNVNLTWNDIMVLSNQGASSPIRNHPNLHAEIMITTNEVSVEVAKHLDNETFGNIQINAVSTSEEALELARQLLA